MSEILGIFRREEAALRRAIARYRPNIEDVNEIYQDAFLKCYAAELESIIHNPRAFAYQVVKNLAISEARRKHNSTTASIEETNALNVIIDDRNVPGEDQVDSRRKLVLFTEAVASLPEELREAFLLRKIDGLKFKQIALRLDVSVSTVEKRVAAALLHCAKHLRANGYSMSGEARMAPPPQPRSTVTPITRRARRT